MLAIVLSAVLHGIEGRVVRVEVDVAPGLPGFTIVGLPDVALREARERVRGAIRNSGFAFPPRRITVNLAPAEVRKAGASLDLAIAMAILVGSEQVRASGQWAFLGELSLGSNVRPVPGILPMVMALRSRGASRLVVPAAALAEAQLAGGSGCLPVATLAEAVAAVRGGPACMATALAAVGEGREEARPAGERPVGASTTVRPAAERPAAGGRRRVAVVPRRVELAEWDDSRLIGTASSPPGRDADATVDLAEVQGQALGRRAMEIALAGGHGLVMVGPPGSGKTLLARAIPGLLPPLDDREALVATSIASAAGEGPMAGLVRRRPFRWPHHTISYAGMVGGGPRLLPGEITRADNGVLFLDELPEFDRDVIEALRQPMEDGRVSIVRAGGSVILPAAFQLVAAMNPCPCGGATRVDAGCRCPAGVPERYAARVSGPLRDRVDLWVEMSRVPPAAVVEGRLAESSAAVAERIRAARERARSRGGVNSRLAGRRLRAACGMEGADRVLAADIATGAGLSARGVERLLRVARTIADLEDAAVVAAPHLGEAARFRLPSASSVDRLVS